MRKSRPTRPTSGTTARRWIAARHSSGTAATSPPGTESCCERWKPFEECGMGNGEGEKADGKCQMADGKCQMADDGCRTGNDRGEMADGKCRMADDSGEMADGKCRMADDSGEMADGSGEMADDGCEVRSGGCGDGQSGETTPQAPSEDGLASGEWRVASEIGVASGTGIVVSSQ